MGVEDKLTRVLSAYQSSFSAKAYGEENDDHDVLMDVFSITPEMKRENRQYWGRELGMCWQRIVTELCRATNPRYGPAIRIDADEPCDLTVGEAALDTKYRIGSGDSGTLKKFKAYGPVLRARGYQPILLILRDDNLPAAITACLTGGWSVYQGAKTFEYLQAASGFDLHAFLLRHAHTMSIGRP